MNKAIWACMREYIASEIELSHLWRLRDRRRGAEFCDFRNERLNSLDIAIGNCEEQSTRMEAEIRRLLP